MTSQDVARATKPMPRRATPDSAFVAPLFAVLAEIRPDADRARVASQAQIAAYVDGWLGTEDGARFDAAMMVCASLRDEVEDLRERIGVLDRWMSRSEGVLAMVRPPVYLRPLEQKGKAPMNRPGQDGDDALIAAMLAGDEAALATFKIRHERLFLAICRSVTPTERSASDALQSLLGVPSLGALFRGFKGGSSFSTFATKVLVDGFLFERLLGLMRTDRRIGFVEFEAFFARRIGRILKSRILDAELRNDASQWVMAQILESDLEQIATWAEQAKTPGYIVTKLRYLVDDFRNSEEAPQEGRKKTLPKPILALSAFDQTVFKQVYWSAGHAFSGIQTALRNAYPEITDFAVLAARARIDTALASTPHWRGYTGAWSIAPLDGSAAGPADEPAGPAGPPEDEPAKAAFRGSLLRVARGLNERERRYLLKLLQMKTAAQIAEEQNEPVEDIYKLGKSVVNKLRTRLASDAAAQALFVTLTGRNPVPKTGARKGSATLAHVQKGLGS